MIKFEKIEGIADVSRQITSLVDDKMKRSEILKILRRQETLKSLYDEFQQVACNTAGNPSLGKGEMIHIYSSHISKNTS